jgi:hypothetical protein
MNTLTNANPPTSNRLTKIGDTLANIGAGFNRLIGQNRAPSIPRTLPPGVGGPNRRFSDEEEQEIVRMLKRPDLYTVQEIASKMAASRPAIYGVRDRNGLTVHKRQTFIPA